MAQITVNELSIGFRGPSLLDRASCQIDYGQRISLLGRNGAGKTTLVSIIAGLRKADAGQVRVGGIDPNVDPHRVHQLLGMAPQETGVYPSVSCRQNLRYFARLAGRGRREVVEIIDELAAALGLTDLLDRHAQELSGGERRRLHMAVALVGRPRLVLLDEPTVGADVQTRVDIIAFVGRLAATGTAVLYSTHYLGEVEELDASVVILDQGRIAARGTVAEIVTGHAIGSVELAFAGPPLDLPVVPGEIGREASDGRLRIETRSTGAITAAIVGGLGDRLPDLREVTVTEPDLEAAFLAVAQDAADDREAEASRVA